MVVKEKYSFNVLNYSIVKIKTLRRKANKNGYKTTLKNNMLIVYKLEEEKI